MPNALALLKRFPLLLKDGTTTDSEMGITLTAKNAKSDIAISELSKVGVRKTPHTAIAETIESIPMTEGLPFLLDLLNQKGLAMTESVGVTAIRMPISTEEKPLLWKN
ncbi:hypothetical protein PHOSAC3_70023 [Mesotoga infera]|nr:hypothetical protein PHOSAC3_70023 [Mesotoga infera]